MICKGIRDNLKIFLDDLLEEKDYEAFVAHLESCGECKKYVLSVDSFENQLWKLGDVKVPEDLIPAILFELSQPKAKDPKKKPLSLKKWLFWAAIGLVIGLLLYDIVYVRAPKDSLNGTSTNASFFPGQSQKPSLSDGEARSYFNQLQTIASGLEGGEIKSDRPIQAASSRNIVPETGPREESRKENPLQTLPLHWHVRLAEKLDMTPIDQAEKTVEGLRRLKLSQKNQLSEEIETLKKEKRAALGEIYQQADQAGFDQPNEFRKLLLNEKLEKEKVLAFEIASLERQKAKVEEARKEVLQTVDQNKRERQSRIQKVLLEGKNRQSLEKHQVFLFDASGTEVEKALFTIMSLPDVSSFFQDFTQTTATHPEQEYSVSLYLDQPDSGNFHWHIDTTTPEEKNRALEAVETRSASVLYRSEHLIAFYISAENMKGLRGKLRAMRIPFTEFGAASSQGMVLISGPVSVTIYFSK